MTNPVASGLNTSASTSLSRSLQASARPADIGTTQPTWKRTALEVASAGVDGQAVLPSGTGPRPGGLDQAPVVAQGAGMAKKPGAAPSADSRRMPDMEDVVGAAKLALKEGFLQHKMRSLMHPGRALLFGTLGFIDNLIRGRR